MIARAALVATASLSWLLVRLVAVPSKPAPEPELLPPVMIDVCTPVRAAGAPDSFAATGRFWHALQRATPPPGTRPLPAESVLLHATIAEGLGQSARVDELLRRARGGDSLPDLLALGARTDERAERWRSAETRYRRLLELPVTPEPLRLAASVRLAIVLERQGLRDSAQAAWRRAALAAPEIADWFAIRRAALEPDTAVAFATVSGSRTPGAMRQAQLFIAGRRLSLGDRFGALDLYTRWGTSLDVARVEFAVGRSRLARARADSLLLADPTRPTAFLAATFLTERFDTLTLAENLAVSRAYRARNDLASAELYARRATQRSDTSVAARLELARILALRKQDVPALRAVDSAGARAGRRRATIIAAARVQTLSLLGRQDEADTLLGQLVGIWRGDSSIARAVLLRADLHRARGERPEEVARYVLLLRRFGETPAAVTARFRLGLVLYAAGSRDSAGVLVADAVRRDTVGALGAGAAYWDARLRFERGDTAAVTALRRIAAAAPTTFYGTRAREVLGDTDFISDAAIPPPRLGTFPAARARERIRLLTSLGLDAEARAEAVGWAGDSAASTQVLLAAAVAAAEAGYARESIALGEAARARVGLVPGVVRALFPFSFRDVIESEAAEHCVDPLLMAAIIRQESRFDPRALSRANARGLSQIWVPTGQEMVRRLRLGAWDPELLYVPDFNLHLGSRYVSERQTRDSFPVYALIASYNAGPSRVGRWKSWPEYPDPDLFAERVFIPETRDYVRTVYASYVWYRAAYPPAAAAGGPPPLSPVP